MRCRVVAPHRPESGDPLRAAAGERLAFERRPTEWPGWIWCNSAAGRSGWVPERWGDCVGATCTLRRDYDATELAVGPGEIFTVELLESSWAWGANDAGEQGWVPLAILHHPVD